MASRKQRGWTVPGFGLPLQWPQMLSRRWQPLFQPDENTLLLSALDGSEDPKYCYTQRELTMLALINELTDMAEWDRIIFNPDFTFEWKSQKLLTGQDITRAMLDWCVEEVKSYVHDFTPSRIIPCLDGGVIKSDDCVDPLLKHDVQAAAASIRQTAVKRSKTSGSSVVDVVDPHLFPFVFEKTRVLRGGYVRPQDCISTCGQGEPVKRPSDEECVEHERAKYPNEHAYSNHFQWLPFDVTFDDASGSTRLSSYINNVHPITHHTFYTTLSSLISSLLPLFNRTLIDLKAPGYRNQRFHLASLGREPPIKLEPGPFQPPAQRALSQWLDHQGRYSPFLSVDVQREFWNIGIQMVLHMRDINLTPSSSSSTYAGEEWHITGQLNERICATAHYIYSSKNITPPTLSFRRRINPEEAGLAKGYLTTPPLASDIYGAEDGEPAVQTLGDVKLQEDRVVVFPNTFQSKLSPFALADASKPGHLRILTLHLVDPNRRLMSTGMVPCQRRDWWADAVRTTCPRFWRLPLEVWGKIVDAVDGWPVSMEEGLQMRQDFLRERDEFRKQHTRSLEAYLGWDLRRYDEDDEWVQI